MNMNSDTKRYCSIEESIVESMKEVKLMREGKLPKKTWQDYLKEQNGKQQ